MVTPGGSGRAPDFPARGGPSPDRLVLGSEGTLGVITEAWMRVSAARASLKASVWFEDYDAAVDAVQIALSRLFPSNCRLLDRNEALIGRVAMGTHVLLLGFESADHAQRSSMDAALRIAQRHGGTLPKPAVHTSGKSADGDAAGAWRRAFLRAPYLQTGLLTMGVMADTFETAITWDRFHALHADVVETMNAALQTWCGGGLVACRFTHVYPDGPAPYYTYLARLPDGDVLEAWWALKRAASDALPRHGATITHHHAVGRAHMPWYVRQRPDLFGRALASVKQSLDPQGILNPGVLVREKD